MDSIGKQRLTKPTYGYEGYVFTVDRVEYLLTKFFGNKDWRAVDVSSRCDYLMLICDAIDEQINGRVTTKLQNEIHSQENSKTLDAYMERLSNGK